MIENYDKFSRWNAKFGRITHFEKFIFINKWLPQDVWSIGATTCIFNNKLQNISLKKIHMKKWKKTKKDSQPFCKVILLAPFYILAPLNENICKQCVLNAWHQWNWSLSLLPSLIQFKLKPLKHC